ncbi:ChaN family lipoprotein [Haliangium sp. UPWRP_2]|uniref:ChaN family lipoprotein n=1 Tax=Haliangium sp. UPWRP_2 TaxID=1931276 RepID=UPI001304C39C|nr:ChaN family lipoprotein [Haliangium sp. UPWRP_2]
MSRPSLTILGRARPRAALFAALLLSLWVACASAPPKKVDPPASAPSSSTAPPPVAEPGASPASTPHGRRPHGQGGLFFAVRDGKNGSPVSPAALADRLAAARAIYVGEHHNSVLSHHAQLYIVSQVYRLGRADGETGSGPTSPEGRDLAVGLEMLPRRLQPQLDAYLAGAIDEEGFLSAVDWSHTWGFDFALYRPIFDFCRTHGLRMYALNAPRELPRAVRQRGLAGLSPEELAQLPSGVPWPMPEPHRRFVRDIFNQHGAPAKTPSPAEAAERDAAFERFYAAQLVWDESMAQAVAEILAPGPKNPRPPGRLIILAGVGHVGLYAMPARAARRGAPASLTFAPQEDEKEPPPPPQDPESTDLTLLLPAHHGS